MRPRNRKPVLGIAFVAALLLGGATGCAADSGIVQQIMDPETSVMISFSETPMVFYRDVAGRAAYARDYIHFAPLEINRSGKYRYFLWLGIWNTMQDAGSATVREGFDSVVVFADGEPLPLEVAGWTAATIGASAPVYLKPVASAADAYYEITIDQLRVIAEANDVRVQSTGAKGAAYEAWDDQKSAKKSLKQFLSASSY